MPDQIQNKYQDIIIGEKDFYDRLIREKERETLTTLGRVQTWALEKEGKFPRRRKLYGGGSINVWFLSEIMEWIQSREGV